MTQMEMRLSRKEILSERLAQKFESITIDERTCFLIKDGFVCRLDSMSEPYNALVIEYADNLELAKKGIFGEDGDLFYMDEMSESEMFEAMVREIEEL
ncbi:MAG: hypothetical protein IJ439_03630 [Tyzzerella sp.]|nr:hypothetical protein [Tyzzerella sp.]